MTDPDTRDALRTLGAPPPRERWLVLIGVAVLLVIVAGIVIAVNAGQTQDTAMKATTTAQKAQGGVEQNKHIAVTAGKRADNAQRKATAVQKRLKVVEIRTFRDHTVLREKQIIGPNGQPGPGGLRGPQGPPGKVPFTLSEILAALSPMLTEALADRLPAALDVACGGPCNGKDGTDGRDGKDAPPVTPEAINAAVAANCGGSCKGDPGVNGTNGVDGTNGTNGVDGLNGQNGTPGTIVLSVQTACPDGNGGFVAGVATDPDGDGNFTCP